MQFTFSPASLAQHAHPTDKAQASNASGSEFDAESKQAFGELLAESTQRHRGTLPAVGGDAREGAAEGQPQSQQPPGERVGQQIAGMLNAVQVAPEPQAEARAEAFTLAGADDAAAQPQAAEITPEDAPARLGAVQRLQADAASDHWTAPIAALIEPEVVLGQHTETQSHPIWDVDAPSTSTVASFSASTEERAATTPAASDASVSTADAPSVPGAEAPAAVSQREVEADELESERSRQNEADALAREQAEASFRAALWSAPYPGMLVGEQPVAPQAPVTDATEQAWQSSLQRFDDGAYAGAQQAGGAASPADSTSFDATALEAAADAAGEATQLSQAHSEQVRRSQQAADDAGDVNTATDAAGAETAQAAAQLVAPQAGGQAGAPGAARPSSERSAAGQVPGAGASHAHKPVGLPKNHLPSQAGAEAQSRADEGLGAAPVQSQERSEPSVAPASTGARNDAAPGALQATNSVTQATSEPVRAIASEQLAQTLAQSAAQGVGNVRLRIMPEGLGELDVRVRVQKGQVRLQIEGDAPELAQLIGRNMPALREALGAHALVLDELQFGSAPADADGHRASEQSFADFAEQFGTRQDEREGQSNNGAPAANELEALARTQPSAAHARANLRTQIIDVTL